jgi:hypothetical protein
VVGVSSFWLNLIRGIIVLMELLIVLPPLIMGLYVIEPLLRLQLLLLLELLIGENGTPRLLRDMGMFY